MGVKLPACTLKKKKKKTNILKALRQQIVDKPFLQPYADEGLNMPDYLVFTSMSFALNVCSISFYRLVACN